MTFSATWFKTECFRRSWSWEGRPPAWQLAAWSIRLGVLIYSVPCHAESTPMGYLRAFGPKGERIANLTWMLLIVSVLVIVIIAVLTTSGVLLRGSSASDVRSETLVRRSSGLAWIAIGVGISTLALVGMMGWTIKTMAAINRPDQAPAFTVEVIGHQWWWELRYVDKDVSRIFTTANEIHIPVGEPVQFDVKTTDVIHSFWVPALGDKIDLIPNQTNSTWLQASRPGIYRGQCAEYCGKQHAHMAIAVVAQSPAEFRKWWDAQLAPAAPAAAEMAKAEDLFILRCGACHSVRGTRAGGRLGPDLTHLRSRLALAAETVPNTRAYLSGWIADPQRIKPGNLMPTLELSGPELESIRGFLENQD